MKMDRVTEDLIEEIRISILEITCDYYTKQPRGIREALDSVGKLREHLYAKAEGKAERLILIELEEPFTADGIAKAVSVWELPTAQELGRVAMYADTEPMYRVSVPEARAAKVGEAILAALRMNKSKEEKETKNK